MDDSNRIFRWLNVRLIVDLEGLWFPSWSLVLSAVASKQSTDSQASRVFANGSQRIAVIFQPTERDWQLKLREVYMKFIILGEPLASLKSSSLQAKICQ
ncbi:hypothetical protein HNY73_010481 [Argiope bruennichi]|uniref:Uncharacterized protein n=1 Tax=Argiope bruennichi TaxID=94029 RepID=A0A8T0F1A3_ARGBR|nr:hypothetical protein HNY73_010481 [Argiope bruennichi]